MSHPIILALQHKYRSCIDKHRRQGERRGCGSFVCNFVAYRSSWRMPTLSQGVSSQILLECCSLYYMDVRSHSMKRILHIFQHQPMSWCTLPAPIGPLLLLQSCLYPLQIYFTQANRHKRPHYPPHHFVQESVSCDANLIRRCPLPRRNRRHSDSLYGTDGVLFGKENCIARTAGCTAERPEIMASCQQVGSLFDAPVKQFSAAAAVVVTHHATYVP